MSNTSKIVVYTSITNGYDQLLAYALQEDQSIDFICFTDNMSIDPKNWCLHAIPDELSELSPSRKNRALKILPHRWLPNYDISIYIDGNIEVIGDIRQFVSLYKLDEDNRFFYVRRHPCRRTFIEEAFACKKLKKDVAQIIDKQVKAYIEDGFNDIFSLTENNILLRNHNSEKCKTLDEFWYSQLEQYSGRDQLSFCYSVWKTKVYHHLFDKNADVERGMFFKKHWHLIMEKLNRQAVAPCSVEDLVSQKLHSCQTMKSQ